MQNHELGTHNDKINSLRLHTKVPQIVNNFFNVVHPLKFIPPIWPKHLKKKLLSRVRSSWFQRRLWREN